MARVIADRVMETTTTTGTGDLTLAGPITGFQAFSSVAAPGDLVDYTIFAVDGSGVPTGPWETGRGTYSAPNTLARTTVQASSTGGTAVSFAAGLKHVMMSHNASSIARYRFGSFFIAEPAANEILMAHPATDAFSLPANLVGSLFLPLNGATNPSAETVFSLQVTAVEFGTISVSSSGVVTLSSIANVINAGSTVTLVAPANSNGITGWAWTLRGVV